MADYTFDALNKSTNIVLTGDDLIATSTNGTDYRWEGVSVAPDLSLGSKLYTEFEVIASTYDAVMFGVIYNTTGYDYNNSGSYQTNAVTYSAGGYSYYPPASILGATYGTGDIISITIDEAEKDISFYKNNVFQFTVNAPIMTGPYRFSAHLARYLGVQPSVKFLPADLHNYEPPAGFTEFGQAPANPDRPGLITQLYNISSVKGNLRGKCAEGFVRPTVKQFFTSKDFEEIPSRVFIGYSANLCTSSVGANADSQVNNGRDVGNIFPPIDLGGWISDTGFPHFVSFDFGEGNEKAIMKYSLTAHYSNPYHACAPHDFIFQGSNDYTNWDDLDTQEAPAWTVDETRAYTIDNEVEYRYYRVYIINNGGSCYTSASALGKLEMYEGIYE